MGLVKDRKINATNRYPGMMRETWTIFYFQFRSARGPGKSRPCISLQVSRQPAWSALVCYASASPLYRPLIPVIELQTNCIEFGAIQRRSVRDDPSETIRGKIAGGDRQRMRDFYSSTQHIIAFRSPLVRACRCLDALHSISAVDIEWHGGAGFPAGCVEPCPVIGVIQPEDRPSSGPRKADWEARGGGNRRQSVRMPAGEERAP